jgi:hypothetical protein
MIDEPNPAALPQLADASVRVLPRAPDRLSRTETAVDAAAIRSRRGLLIVLALGGLLIATVMLGVLVVNLLLRSRLESAMNQYMTHHRVSLGYAHFKVFYGMLVLRNFTILQKAHPSSPIMHLGEARISIQWFDLIRGHIVANCVILAPTIELTAAQLKTEVAFTNLRDIQRAILEAPNIMINRVEVREFNFAYVDATRRLDMRI